MKRLIATALVFGCCTSITLADDVWPQWRGPQRDAKVSGPGWPKTLNDDNVKQLWRIPLGPSYSGPIVSKSHVFVTETKDKRSEVTRALDRKTGEQVWEKEWKAAMTVPFFAMANGSWIRATPAYDGERLYVASMLDMMVCLNAATGDEEWQIDFAKQNGSNQPSFGNVASPLIRGDYLYTQAGGGFVKIDKKTGEIKWNVLKNGNGMNGGAFSSPIVATIAGREMFIVQTRQRLVGVDIESGQELWTQTVPAFRGMNILTPTVLGDSIFTSTYQGGSFMFDVESTGTGMSIQQRWKNKVQAYMSSPVVVDGHAYMHLRNKNLVCLDLASGEQKWITKKHGPYWSMVANQKQILALDAKGELLLFDANPNEFKVLGKKKVSDESTWAHLAVCNNEVFVRELKAIAVYQWGAASVKTAAINRPASK